MAPTIPGFQDINLCVQYIASHPQKPILYTSDYYDESNVIRLTCGGNQVEYYTTQNFLEFRQYEDHARILNIRRSVLAIINTMIDVSVLWKVQIKTSISSESTDGEIICMFKAANKTKSIWRYIKP